MKKRILSAVLASFLVIGMTACGADASPEAATEVTTAAEETTTAAETTAPETTTEETTTTPPPPEPEREVEFGTLGAPTIIEFDGIRNDRHIYFNGVGRYTGYMARTLNDDGNDLRGEIYNADGTLSYSYEAEYEGEDPQKVVFKNPDGSVMKYAEYGYDDKGDWTKYTRYNPDGTINY